MRMFSSTAMLTRAVDVLHDQQTRGVGANSVESRLIKAVGESNVGQQKLCRCANNCLEGIDEFCVVL